MTSMFFFFRGIAAPPKISPETVAYYENLMKRMTETTMWKEKYLKKYMLSPYVPGEQGVLAVCRRRTRRSSGGS